MKKSTLIWLIVAASLVLIGSLLFVGVMAILHWDFMELSTSKYETNTHSFSEDFDSISLQIDTADVIFLPADGTECRVVCQERVNHAHSVSVQDSTLIISNQPTPWYNSIGIHFGSPKITVYLPKAEYASLVCQGSTGSLDIPKGFSFGDVNASLSTGNVRIADATVGKMNISVSTGKISLARIKCAADITLSVSTGDTELDDISCQNLFSQGNTGDISLDHVIAAGRFSIERSTGDVEFEGSDAAEIYVKTDTGEVEGSLLSDKVFFVTTSTGNTRVPQTTTGGRCEITTSTGDVTIYIQQNQ